MASAVKKEKDILHFCPNIYQRINGVMKEVKYIQKESKKVNGQYTFASHDAVVAAIHDPLVTHGIVMVPHINSLVQDGPRTIVHMTVSFVNMDMPEDKVQIDSYGYGIDNSDKGIGKGVSYAVKYAILKMFCLETGDDCEKDNIEMPKEEIPLKDVDLKLTYVLKLFSEEDKELVMEYLKLSSENMKIPMKNFLFLITNPENIVSSFGKWKEKQSKAIA